MNNILLVTVTKIETQTVMDLFLKKTGKEHEWQRIGNNIYFPLGEIGGVSVNLVQSEMGATGPGASILTISEAINHFSPIAVIMVGIAFGVNSQKQKFGDVIISDKVFSYEPQKVEAGKIKYRGNTVPVNSSILKIFRSGEIQGWKGQKVHFGTLFSGEKLINDFSFREQLLKEKPEAIGGEMEGCGLFSAAHDSKVDWIVVKGICDFADGNKNDDTQSLAAKNATEFVLHVISCGFFGTTSANNSVDNSALFTKIPDALYKIAKEQIDKKRNLIITDLRPGFDFGEMEGLIKVGPSKHGTLGIAQFYQYGVITFHLNGINEYQTFATYGGIFSRFIHISDNPWQDIGLPISDEGEITSSPIQVTDEEGNKGRYSKFEDGDIVWYASGNFQDQAFVILDPIRIVYDSVGGSGSYLGLPINSTYRLSDIDRSDFEGGSIVCDKKKGLLSIVRNLVRIDYSDSPFVHGWVRYAGPEDEDFFKTRLDTRAGFQKNMLSMIVSWPNRGVFFPREKFKDVTERFCGISIKSLTPSERIRVFIRIRTEENRNQYLEFDSRKTIRSFVHDQDEDVDYWQIPLPQEFENSEWHTLMVDLKQMVNETFGTKFINIERFYFRGRIGISDILVSNSHEAIEAVAINPFFLE